jgi:hypothetical protein
MLSTVSTYVVILGLLSLQLSLLYRDRGGGVWPGYMPGPEEFSVIGLWLRRLGIVASWSGCGGLSLASLLKWYNRHRTDLLTEESLAGLIFNLGATCMMLGILILTLVAGKYHTDAAIRWRGFVPGPEQYHPAGLRYRSYGARSFYLGSMLFVAALIWLGL